MIGEIELPLPVDQYLDTMGAVVGISSPEVVRRKCRAGDLGRLKAVRLEGGNRSPWIIHVKMDDIPLPGRMTLFENPNLPEQARRGAFEGVKTLLLSHGLRVNNAGSIEPTHWPELLAYYSHWAPPATGAISTGPAGPAGSILGASP